MDRVFLVLGAVAIASVVATVLGRRSDPPAGNTGHVPSMLDRRDFDRPDAAWLVAVFTSATCKSCADVLERARPLESPEVAVQEIEVSTAKRLHDRYRIDAVPTLTIVDADGVVKRGFLGPVTTAELWAAMAETRD